LSAEPETQDRRSPIDLVDLVRRYWHYIALVAVTAWLIYQVRSILGPFIIGILAGYILDPALDRLERKGWSRSRAVAFVFMLGFLLLAVAVLVLVPLLITQIQSLADTVGDTAEKIEAWVHTMPGVEETVEAAQDSPEDESAPEEPGEPDAPPAEDAAPGEEAAAAVGTEEGAPATEPAPPEEMSPEERQEAQLRADWNAWYDEHLPEWVPGSIKHNLPAVDVSDPAEGLMVYREQLTRWGQGIATRIGSIVWGSVSTLFFYIFTPFVAYYFMRDIDPLRKRVWAWIPDQYHEKCNRASQRMNGMLASYFRGQLTLMFLAFCACWVVLLILKAWLGIDNILIVAATNGLLYAVPVLGPVVASSVAVIVGFSTADGNPWIAALIMLAVIQGLNLVFDQVVTPKIAGQKVGLHPLVVIFSVLAGATLLGFVGMLIAIPTAGAIKIVINTFMPEVFENEEDGAADQDDDGTNERRDE
jgi:predicted PurR-regulated permease PerM